MIENNIILIGPSGVGKSTIGRALSIRLNKDFIDLDNYIEEITGRKVEDILKKSVEEFRNIETSTLKIILSSCKNIVLSVGGGTPCFDNNMELMNKSGITIFLDANIDDILENVINDKINIRPLLNIDITDKKEIKYRIYKQYESRKKIYKMSQKHIKIDRSVTDNVNKITKILDNLNKNFIFK